MFLSWLPQGFGACNFVSELALRQSQMINNNPFLNYYLVHETTEMKFLDFPSGFLGLQKYCASGLIVSTIIGLHFQSNRSNNFLQYKSSTYKLSLFFEHFKNYLPGFTTYKAKIGSNE